MSNCCKEIASVTNTYLRNFPLEYLEIKYLEIAIISVCERISCRTGKLRVERKQVAETFWKHEHLRISRQGIKIELKYNRKGIINQILYILHVFYVLYLCVIEYYNLSILLFFSL